MHYLNTSSRVRNTHSQENSSSNQNEALNMSQPNNRRLISLSNQLNQDENFLNNNYYFFNNNFEDRLNEVQNCILNLLTTERKKIKDSQDNVDKMKNDFYKFKKKELEKLNQEKNDLKFLFKLSNGAQENDILELNIGGTHQITTTRGTLIKYKNSALAVFFSGVYPLPKINNKIFIDREGETFINLVNFLRTGKFPIVKTKEDEIKFLDELNFWKINIQEIKMFSKNFEFDSEWCAPTLNLTENNKILKKSGMQHGVVFCKPCLDEFCPYIEFKVKIITTFKEKSQLFIGLVDKTKYKLENLSSKLWRDSPSAYYWDVWCSSLIKTNENGGTVVNMKGYGCVCMENDTILGIKFDHVKRTISFYKNGINHGVAFRNVPAGLTPALDVWFGEGQIEIQNNVNFEDKTFL